MTSREFDGHYRHLRLHVHHLRRVGDALVQALPVREAYPEFVRDLMTAYRHTVNLISDSFRQLKKYFKAAKMAGNPQPPRVSLEMLENIFTTLRDSAEEADFVASKAEHRRDRDAGRLRASARELLDLTRQAAGILDYEATIRAKRTAKWARDLDIDAWL